MQLHLPGHILPVEMRIPPAPLVLIGGAGRVRTNKRNAEVSLAVLYDGRLLRHLRGLTGGIHHGTRGALVLVHRGALAVLCLPRVVNLEAAVEFVPTSLKESSCSDDLN